MTRWLAVFNCRGELAGLSVWAESREGAEAAFEVAYPHLASDLLYVEERGR